MIKNETKVTVDKDTRAILKQLAAKDGLPVWQYVKKLALEKLGKNPQGVLPSSSPLVREDKLDTVLKFMTMLLVYFTATGGRDIAIEAIRQAAPEYLPKAMAWYAELTQSDKTEAQGVSDRKLIPNEEVG